MAAGNQAAKLFGALVLGGGMLVHAAEPQEQTKDAKTGPGDQAKPVPAPTSKPTTKRGDRPKAKTQNKFCQIELTLNKFDRGGNKSPITTCIDGKTDAEILKLVEDAKKQTCSSPFCGCWLG